MYKFIFLIFMLVFTSCGHNPSKENGLVRLEVTVVDILPQGFIKLDTAGKEAEGLLDFIFWKTQIAVTDSENITIFQTNVSDSSFIVNHEGENYINDKDFLKLVEYSMDKKEQLNRIYSIGDLIEIRGVGGKKVDGFKEGKITYTYTLVITEIREDNINGKVVYDIHFTIDPVPDEKFIIGFFEYVETNNRKKYDDFTMVGERTARIEVGDNESLNMIVLAPPRGIQLSGIQNSMRIIEVSSSNEYSEDL